VSLRNLEQPDATPNVQRPATAAHAVLIPERRPLPTLTRYLIPLGAVAGAFVLTMLFEPYLTRVIFAFFWVAVIATATYAGLGPAIIGSVLSVGLVGYWFMPPEHSLALLPIDLIGLAVFFFASSVVSAAADRRRVAERRAAAAARENATLATRIEDQTTELESQLEESQALAEELEQLTTELETQRQEAEAATLFSRGILESITDPFVVQDTEWRFRYINDAAAKTLSSHGNREYLLGRVLWEVYPEIRGTAFEREMRRSARDRVPIQFEAFYAERGDWAELSCYPLPDGGLATQWKNITAKKKADEARHYLDRATELLTSPLDPEERLANLARLVVPDLADWCAVEIVDDEGVPRQVAVAHADPAKVEWARELNRRYPPNPDATTGVPNVLRSGKAELYPEITDEMLVSGAIDDEHLRITRELGLRSAMIVPLTVRDRTFGALTLVSAESRRRYDDADLALAGELARRAAFAIDSARQHQRALAAQREAENANLAKSQFLAAMSHELRTPLNAIAGYAQLLSMGVRGPITNEQRLDVERIEQSQRHLLGLINDVLEFARIEAGRVEYHVSPIPVSTLLSELEDFVRPQLRERELEFHCDEPGDGVLVRADPEKARQILLNLLSNAVKFTPQKGRIDVTCEQVDGRVLVRVHDTGIGIADDRVDSVFEPFVQAHRTLTDPTGGVGLGLAISRDLARAMGGDLHVESKVGEGSTFTLDLPSAPHDSSE
jgi:signal transduction histidine kinase/PAS domain-containing protein